ncbi:hypothetical protein [Flavobacterium sp.]|uniref:hypothetical protein n=1 Tax=Flavobacterium sp. TaxID=239 RepID=UPI0025F350F9|nr:hypothetical protein [Flavobacterium sp.]
MFHLNLIIMNANVRNEEVSAFGDFVLTSYTRDFDVIRSRFSKLDASFKDEFIAKLNFVKELESSLILTESQKGVTASLYEEAKRLNEDLNFLSAYFKDASLNAGIVTDLKNDLFNGNIEGAILKIEGVRQFVVSNQVALVAQGMDAGFAGSLTDYKVSMTAKNQTQNELINNRKKLTDANQGHYEELLKMI